MQSLLVSKWKQHPGDLVKLQARIIGSIEGPKFVKPEVSTVTIKVKMYSEKTFVADHLYMSGTAVDGEDIEILPMESQPKRYVSICDLKAGNLHFPIVWKDEIRLMPFHQLLQNNRLLMEQWKLKLRGQIMLDIG